jgi:hypothetical protein
VTGFQTKPLGAVLHESVIGSIAVALLLAGGVTAIVHAAEPAVTLLFTLLINRFISQAHLNAAPLTTKVLWGNSVNLAILSFGLVWVGVSLSLWLLPSSEKTQ